MAVRGKPWEDKKWRNGEIRPVTPGLVLAALAGIVFFAIGLKATLELDNALKLPLNIDTLVLLCPLIGTLLLISVFFRFIRSQKWKGSKFVMKSMPGVIGGKLTGVLVISGHLNPDAELEIRLLNIERRRRSSNKNSRTPFHYIFKRCLKVTTGDAARNTCGYTLHGGNQIEVPLDIEIPFEAKDEQDNYVAGRTRFSYQWKLEVKSDIPSMDLNLQFILPVYRTEASDPSINEAKRDAEDAGATMDRYESGQLDFQEIRTHRVGGHEHYISKGRPFALFCIAFVLLSIGIGIGVFECYKIWLAIADAHQLAIKIISIVSFAIDCAIACAFGFFGAVFVFLGILTMGTKEVWVENGKINYIKRLGSNQWQYSIAREFIIDIVVKKCGSTNGNNFYAVNVKHSDVSQMSRLAQIAYQKFVPKNNDILTNGLSLEIARDIDDKAEAHLLAEKIKQQLGEVEAERIMP